MRQYLRGWFADTFIMLLLVSGGIAALVAAMSLAGCAQTTKTAYASLNTAEQVVRVAAEKLPQVAAERTNEIIKTATTLEEGSGRIEDLYLKVTKASQAIEGAHAAIQMARDGVRGVELGAKNTSDVMLWVNSAVRVAKDVVTLLESIGVKVDIAKGLW